MLILEPGLLIEVTKDHLAITTLYNIVTLAKSELLWVVRADSAWQGLMLRISTSDLVFVTSLDPITELPAYVVASR